MCNIYTERRKLTTFPKFTFSNEYVSKLDKSAWIKVSAANNGSDSPMYLSSNVYYLYIKVPNTYVDHVGNSISGASNRMVKEWENASALSGYTIFKQKIEIDQKCHFCKIQQYLLI